MKTSMQNSYTAKYIAVFALSIVFIVIIVLAVNTFGLRYYYEHQRVKSMENAYEEINVAIVAEEYAGLSDILENYSSKENISIVLYDTYTSVAAFSSARDNEFLIQRLRDKIFGGSENKEIEDAQGRAADGAKDEAGRPIPKERVLAENDDYTITANVTDLELVGYCYDNRTMVLMTSPIQGMKNLAQQSTRFLIIVAAAALLIGFVAVIIMTIRVSRVTQLEIENEKLQHDLKEKEKQNEIQREFVANVSHELKTPITLVQGYAEGLADGLCEDAESRKYYADVIVDEAARMNGIVRQLLLLSSIEAGTDRLEKSQFDFSELVNTMAEQIGILAEKKNVAIETDVTEGITAYGDEFKIESVVTNYLSNAINHVDDNGTIRISLKAAGGRARLNVFNTGSSIPEEEIEHIWDKFYKVDKSHTRRYGGSGIGLSVVRAVMDAHGMPYGVANHDGGVEFYMELEATL